MVPYTGEETRDQIVGSGQSATDAANIPPNQQLPPDVEHETYAVSR